MIAGNIAHFFAKVINFLQFADKGCCKVSIPAFTFRKF